MKQQNESVKKLEVGKDYINVLYSKFIVIDRAGDFDNKGFYKDLYKKDIPCTNYGSWREATKEEVIEAFRKHLVYRYGKDWETMKIKDKHPDSTLEINHGFWDVEFSKLFDSWNVWNKNGLLYRNGIWVERLEEKELEKIHIKDAIKGNTVVHCETEQEANRVLGMAHTLGYKWWIGKNYKNNTEWGVYKSKMCYDLFEGSYSHYDYFKNKNYTIIPSTQIADVGEKKSTDSSPASEDIEATKVDKEMDKYFQLKREVLTILSVESKLNPDKKISEYLEQFRVILEVL